MMIKTKKDSKKQNNVKNKGRSVADNPGSPTPLFHQSAKENDLQKIKEELSATRKELQTALEHLKQANEEIQRLREEDALANKELRAAHNDLVKTNLRLKDEVAEHKLAEQNAKKERKKFSDVLETLPVYLVLLTTDYHVPFANRFFRKRFGESLGMRCYEYLFERTEPCETCESFTVLKTNQPHHWEWLGPDGRNYDVYDFPFTDFDGSPMIMEMGIDITDLKKSQAVIEELNKTLEERVVERTAALTASEARYRHLFASMSEAVAVHELIVDANGRPRDYRFLEINPEFERLTGLKAKDILGKTVLEVLPGTEPVWIERFGRVAITGEPDHFESFSAQLNRWYEVHAYQTGPGRFAVIFLDVTERKKNEEAIRQAKEEWETTFDSVPDLIAILDDRHKITRVNKAMADRLALEPGQCIGIPCYRAIHGMDEPPGFCPHTKTLADGKQHTTEVMEDRLGGHFLVSTTPMFDENGKLTGSVHVARDITEIKRVEESLLESRGDLNRAQAVARAGSWRLNFLKNELLWSDETYRIFGIPNKTPLSYETFLEMVHPDDREYVDNKWKAGLNGEPYDIEHRIVVAGNVKWVSEKAEMDFDHNGNLLGGFGTVQDITERKIMIQSLQKGEARFRLLSEIAEKLLMTGDPQGMVGIICRKVMAHLDCHVFFNFLVDEQAGKLHLNACAGIPDEEVQKFQWLDYGAAVCGCAARDKAPIVAQNIPANPDPRTDLVKSYGIQAYACHPMMTQGQLLGTLSFGTKTRTTFSDDDLALMKTVTFQIATAMERMRLIEELQNSQDELEIRVEERTSELKNLNEALIRSNKALEEFAYVSSHDLQEPLRKIQTFADRLTTMPELSDNKARDYLMRMQNAASRMRALIQDLLIYSRLAAKPEPFEMINLKEPVEASIEDLGLLIAEAGCEVEVGKLPDVFVDKVQMTQLFRNLIGNALKYHGEQDLVIKIYNASSNSNRFHEIHVKDNGIGFDEKYTDKIFQPFQRLHGKTDVYRGTGIGLAICRRIAENHGGSIAAKSQPGQGSTFIVKLPGKKRKIKK